MPAAGIAKVLQIMHCRHRMPAHRESIKITYCKRRMLAAGIAKVYK